MNLDEDIVYEIATHLQDSRLETSFPLWWVPHDLGLRESVQHLAALALVSRGWVEPTRRALLKAVPLVLGEKQARSFALLLRTCKYAAPAVQILILDFPFRGNRTSDFFTCHRLHFIISACTNLKVLNIDNIPHTMSLPIFLNDLRDIPAAEEITTLGMRCAGPMRLATMPMAAACIPAFPNLSRLALSHVDLAAPWETVQSHPSWHNLSTIHLYCCNVSPAILDHLSTLPLFESVFFGREELRGEDLIKFFDRAPEVLRLVSLPAHLMDISLNPETLNARRPDIRVITNTLSDFPFWPTSPKGSALRSVAAVENPFSTQTSYNSHERGKPAYAIGFEVSNDIVAELCWRLNLGGLCQHGVHEPLPYLRQAAWEIIDARSAEARVGCAAFLSQRVGLPLRIVTVDNGIGEFISRKWYICHYFRALHTPEAFHELRGAIDAHKRYVEGHRGLEMIQQLLGCRSPSQEYIFHPSSY
ncbi:hypothetical protein BOTBODRAFT_146848 [Botryobasidium botryosum FD-172 SS1]|uniref:Uncharacterized protein n=1 Tax=Botryobasidium botryosum (strain FD-172 SS1) TaxID=930990 RepID=A0A067M8L8_BOTB1|nr:hypothetical protein BOTBODRAFT_146848 [Botryobasidium botryosum FD-172 SS1]